MAGGMQVASLFASFGVDSSGLQSGLSGAQTSLGDFAKDFGLKALGVVSASGLAIGAVKAVFESVSDWSTYNIEMDKGATATGLNADAYSRLVQAADDSRVPIEKMTTALEMATKNGYPMSIDMLGQIADKLNAIKDPADKAKLASEIFGKGWADIMPFLKIGSDGIDKATTAIDDNMVATDESIAKAQAYETSVDDVTDAWTGFRNEIGGSVMPVLTDILTGLVDQITQVKLLKTNMDTLKGGVEEGTVSQEDYANAALAANWSTEAGVVATQNLIDKTGIANAKVGEGASLASGYAQSAAAMTAATEGSAAAQTALAIAAADASQKFRDQKAAVTSLDKNFGGIIGLAKQFDTSLEEITKQQKIMNDNGPDTQAYKDAASAIDDVKQSMFELANQVVLDMYQATIAIGGITAAEAESYFNMAVDMGTISREAADAAVEVYGTAIEAINDMEIDPKTGNVNLEVDDADLRSYRPPGFNADVILSANTSAIDTWIKADHFMTVRLLGDASDIPAYGKAEGGSVYASSAYLVGERGPEIFVPESNGQIIPNNKLGDGMASSGGVTNIYNLSLSTTANENQIKQAFELMEAWAL